MRFDGLWDFSMASSSVENIFFNSSYPSHDLLNRLPLTYLRPSRRSPSIHIHGYIHPRGSSSFFLLTWPHQRTLLLSKPPSLWQESGCISPLASTQHQFLSSPPVPLPLPGPEGPRGSRTVSLPQEPPHQQQNASPPPPAPSYPGYCTGTPEHRIVRNSGTTIRNSGLLLSLAKRDHLWWYQRGHAVHSFEPIGYFFNDPFLF